MTDIDGLTDAELRTKLQEYGFPVMPITGTTRKVMVKKLKLLMENKNKINQEGRRSLSRYSSEEESDTDVKIKKDVKNRRVTMGAPSHLPTPSSKVPVRKSTRKNESENEINVSNNTIQDKKIVTSTTSTRTSKIVKMAADEYDTGSDSESEIVERVEEQFKSPPLNNHDNKRGSPIKSQISSSLYSSGRYSTSTDKYVPQKPTEVSYSKTYTTASGSPARYQSSASEYATDRINQIRSRLSLGTPSMDRPSYTSTYERSNDEPKVDTPFLSNFTRRLSHLSATNAQKDNDYSYKNDIIKEHDTNGPSSFSRSYLSSFRAPKAREYGRGDYQSSQDNNRKNNMVSFILIGVVFLFFIVVAVLYLGIHNGSSLVEHTGYKVPYCNIKDPHSKRGHNCLVEGDVQGAIDVYTVLKPELFKRAVAQSCTDKNINPYMTESEIVYFIKENYGLKDEYQIQEDLKNVKVMLFENPKWGISIVQSTDIDNFGDIPANDMDEVKRNLGTMTTALVILYPDLPWKCSILIKVTAIFNMIFFLGGCGIVAYLSKHGYKYYKQYTEKQHEDILLMVEKIVDILQTNASEGTENYLVINHVRDMILPLNERKQLQGTWNKAVKFINDNDSRIRTEVLVVQGEPSYVWRWVGPNLGNSPKNKTWQGQAFETQAGSVNSLPCSPTPCLKIRGMVEEGDRNFMTIKEAVLSKCAQQCKILHCAVDVQRCCVYLKCATKEDAAIAYRNLHGWWYAGHLVTVKYLRVERYLQRYPNAPESGPPYLRAAKPSEDWTS